MSRAAQAIRRHPARGGNDGKVAVSAVARRRIALVGAIALAVATALWLDRATQRRIVTAQDAAVGERWQQVGAPVGGTTLDAVSARFGMRPGTATGARDFNWQTGNGSDLLASLRALDAALATGGTGGDRVQQVKVTRTSHGGFSASAERAP